MKNAVLSVIIVLLACCGFEAYAQGRIIEFDTPKLKVFLPPAGLGNGSTVVACPGGGYTGLAIGHEGYHWAPFFNNLGYALAVLEYKMPAGNREIPMTDVREAFKIIGDSASAWGLDRERIGIMGSSAGGHLASTIATHPTDGCKPAFQILFYPVISLDNAITHKGTRKGFLGENPSDALVGQWSAQNNVTSATAPAFIVLSGDDKVVPPDNSLLYYAALQHAGVPAAMHIYPTGGHGWGFRDRFAYHDIMLADLTDWLGRLWAAPQK